MKKVLLVLLVTMFFSVPASATMIYMDGVNYPSQVQAVADFNYSPATAQISIDLANTSLIDSALTAFAFNAPLAVTGATLTGPAGWSLIFDRDDINTPGQFGLFDIGGITGPNFNGGETSAGIWDGFNDNFIISLVGSGLDLLDDMSFLGLFSELEPGLSDPQNFITRFQAVGPFGEGSDVGIPKSPPPIPEPSTIILLGAGLIGLTFVSRRKNNHKDKGI